MGGGNQGLGLLPQCLGGLSPRGRGKPAVDLPLMLGVGSIPAWAGETGEIGRRGSARGVYPRVGGGNEVLPNAWITVKEGLSPRGRGKRQAAAGFAAAARSIPAWAGETQRHPRIRFVG